MTIKNAKTFPEVYYGLHMVPGVAEYREPEKEPYRILIEETTIKNMDPTFQGKPVYVDHVDEVDVENIQAEADGYVMDSFYNSRDGKHWVKFIVVSDAAKQRIREGWKLSNAYVPQGFTGGGLWHGVEYIKEVTGGEYEHLAIVKHPRYEESIILTPEQFKNYNEAKDLELKKLANAKEKGEPQMKLNIFKRTKVENAIDLESTMVELPKSKKEMTILAVVNALDAVLNMNGYANGDHMVKVGDKDEMSVNDLVKKHMELQNKVAEMEAKNAGGEEGEEVENAEESEAAEIEASEVGDRGGDKSLDNEEEEEAPADKKKEAAKKNAADLAAKKKEAVRKAAALKNAGRGDGEEVAVVEIAEDQVARGRTRYGS